GLTILSLRVATSAEQRLVSFPSPLQPMPPIRLPYSDQILRFFLNSQSHFLHHLTSIGHSWDDVQPFWLSGPAQRSVPVPAGIGKKRNKGDGMIRQLRVALLTGSLLAATALTARAEEACQAAPAAPAAPCAPQFRTICVTERVPETYETTRTVYERVCRQE